jgi:uncharacterized protein (DUF342 family)
MNIDIVTLQFSEQTNQVKAIVNFTTEQDIDIQINDAWIQQELKDNNFENFYILPEGIANFKAAVRAKQSTIIPIAEKRDAEINITLEDNNMHAYIQIKHPYGGKDVTVDDVYMAIQNMNIKKEGINHQAVTEVVKAGKCSRVLIASGKPPIDGVDAYFEVLVEGDKHFGPTIDEYGIANFAESNELSIVQAGDKLMRKIPRTLGENGVDLLGNLIYPVPGRNIQFAETMDGASLSKEDENVLIAKIKGHPIVEERSVRVDPTYVLDKVNLSTGNINFDGSVLVKGDIENNMSVIATGDVTVNGCVIKGIIEAGGKIVVNQGIIGGEIIKEKGKNIRRGAHIKCQGTLTAGFIDNASIEVQANLFVKDYIANSDVISNGDIVVGATGYKGHIFGGNIQALHIVSANLLGSESQVVTKVKVGTPLELTKRYEQKERKLEECEATLHTLSNALIEIGKRESQGPLNNKTKHALSTLISTLQSLIPTICTLGGEKHSLQSKIGGSKTAKIVVRERVFFGVELNLCDKPYIIEQDMIGGIFEIKGDVRISPLGNQYRKEQ